VHLEEARLERTAVATRRTYAWDVVDDVTRQAGQVAETVAYFCILCGFWGLIVYIAMTAALS
jgi:hypothetical protein